MVTDSIDSSPEVSGLMENLSCWNQGNFARERGSARAGAGSLTSSIISSPPPLILPNAVQSTTDQVPKASNSSVIRTSTKFYTAGIYLYL